MAKEAIASSPRHGVCCRSRTNIAYAIALRQHCDERLLRRALALQRVVNIIIIIIITIRESRFRMGPKLHFS